MSNDPSDANAMALVRTTVELEEQARGLARRLIETDVACCVHVQRIDSVYRWDGAVEEAREWLVEARVPTDGTEACWLAMQDGHPYDVPLVEIVAETRVNGAYARWARDALGVDG